MAQRVSKDPARTAEDRRRYNAIYQKWIISKALECENPQEALRYIRENAKPMYGGNSAYRRSGRGRPSLPMSLLLSSDSPPSWGRPRHPGYVVGTEAMTKFDVKVALKHVERVVDRATWTLATARLGIVLSGFSKHTTLREVYTMAQMPEAVWKCVLKSMPVGQMEYWAGPTASDRKVRLSKSIRCALRQAGLERLSTLKLNYAPRNRWDEAGIKCLSFLDFVKLRRKTALATAQRLGLL